MFPGLEKQKGHQELLVCCVLNASLRLSDSVGCLRLVVMVVVSQFNGTSTPKGSYSAKTGDNDCNVNSSRYSLRNALCESNSLSGQVWTKCPTTPDTQGAPLGGCSHAPRLRLEIHVKELRNFTGAFSCEDLKIRGQHLTRCSFLNYLLRCHLTPRTHPHLRSRCHCIFTGIEYVCAVVHVLSVYSSVSLYGSVKLCTYLTY